MSLCNIEALHLLGLRVHTVPTNCAKFVFSYRLLRLRHPLACRYPEDAWEILLGYDQEKFMGIRAGDAVLKGIKAADERASNVHKA